MNAIWSRCAMTAPVPKQPVNPDSLKGGRPGTHQAGLPSSRRGGRLSAYTEAEHDKALGRLIADWDEQVGKNLPALEKAPRQTPSQVTAYTWGLFWVAFLAAAFAAAQLVYWFFVGGGAA